jgi:hypothetical protein
MVPKGFVHWPWKLLWFAYITLHTIFSRHLMVVVSNAHLYIICDPSNCALGVRHVLIFFAAVWLLDVKKFFEKKEVVVNCLNPFLALCDTRPPPLYTAKIFAKDTEFYFILNSLPSIVAHSIIYRKCPPFQMSKSIWLNIPSKSWKWSFGDCHLSTSTLIDCVIINQIIFIGFP